jgi:3-hydroxymyristoyl/3-hydroxydecanoyl-(acyl carrier protein) dehydratase
MNTLPRVIASEWLTEKSLLLTLGIAPEAVVFQGHFPGQPILPGVAQIDWAVRFSHHYFGDIGIFSGMERIKFHRIVQPQARMRLRLDRQSARGRLIFDYRQATDGLLCASGCLRFSR